MSAQSSAAAPQTGLALAQHMLATHADPPIGKTLEFSLVEVEQGRAVFARTPGRNACNPMGIVHGGYAATLLDSACGIATLTRLPEGHTFTTLELKVAYHKAMDEGTGPVRAAGTVTSIGRRVAFAEGRLTDAEGSATSTLLVIAP